MFTPEPLTYQEVHNIKENITKNINNGTITTESVHEWLSRGDGEMGEVRSIIEGIRHEELAIGKNEKSIRDREEAIRDRKHAFGEISETKRAEAERYLKEIAEHKKRKKL